MNNRFLVGIALSAVFAAGAWLTFSQMIAPTSISVSLYVFLACIISLFASGSGPQSAATDKPSKPKEVPSNAQTTTLYVGNLPYKANEDAVKDFFVGFVAVKSVRLMKDKRTGKRKGYGFIEIVSDDVDSVIAQLNDIVFHERTLKVRPAKEKTEE